MIMIYLVAVPGLVLYLRPIFKRYNIPTPSSLLFFFWKGRRPFDQEYLRINAEEAFDADAEEFQEINEISTELIIDSDQDIDLGIISDTELEEAEKE